MGAEIEVRFPRQELLVNLKALQVEHEYLLRWYADDLSNVLELV
jgi:hypothetical protein